MFVHDLRSPIAAISANFGYLKMAVGSADPSLLEALQDAEVATQALQQIVDNMSLLASFDLGIAPTVPDDVNLADAVLSSIGRLAPISRASEVRVEAVLDRSSPGPRVLAPPELVRACLDNLVLAGVRHTPRKSVVRVGARIDGSLGVLEVEDGGGPVPREIAADLFTAEGQRAAKREPHSRYGRGLGLLVAGLAARAAGATVEAVTRDDRNVCRAAWKLSGS